jgi:hypothetical protein
MDLNEQPLKRVPTGIVKPFCRKGFHFGAGYDCHVFVMEMSSGLCSRVMNDKNVPDGMTMGEIYYEE